MRLALSTVIIATVAGPLLAEDDKHGGQLQRARDEVRPKSEHQSSDHGSSPPPSHDHDYDPDQALPHEHGRGTWTAFGWFANEELDPTQTTPAGGMMGPGQLAYPYADGQRGWLINELAPPPDPTKPATARVRLIGGSLRGEYTDGSDGLQRYAGALTIALGPLRVEGDLQRYIEHLPDDHTDTLTLGTIGLALAIPMAGNAIALTFGGGLSFYHDHYGNEDGWYAKAGAEVFPIRPLVLSAEVWGGFIADDEFDETETFMGSGRATVGVVWNRFEIYGGWQATWIGAVTLDGPTGGLRVWF
jgi:hypothetical protein